MMQGPVERSSPRARWATSFCSSVCLSRNMIQIVARILKFTVNSQCKESCLDPVSFLQQSGKNAALLGAVPQLNHTRALFWSSSLPSPLTSHGGDSPLLPEALYHDSTDAGVRGAAPGSRNREDTPWRAAGSLEGRWDSTRETTGRRQVCHWHNVGASLGHFLPEFLLRETSGLLPWASTDYGE